MVQFSSVAQSCQNLCNPVDCSTPGFPVLHQPLELSQIHVHRVSDAIQPSHLSSVIPFSPYLQTSWPMDCSMPGFPVYHQLPQLAQTHVHCIGDAIQPSHPLSSPSLPTFSLPSIRIFSSESALWVRWPKYWSFQWIFRLVSFRMDWFDLLAFQVPQFES